MATNRHPRLVDHRRGGCGKRELAIASAEVSEENVRQHHLHLPTPSRKTNPGARVAIGGQGGSEHVGGHANEDAAA
jgi:hypothetical protein